jgi:methylmalonyl-CoA mutase
MSNQTTDRQTGEELSAPTFTEFPVPSYEEWREAAVAALKGGSFEKRLITKTHEGIELQPMYRAEDAADLPQVGTFPGFAPYVRGTEPLGYKLAPWEVSQELAETTPEAFNQALLADLERGQTEVNVRLDVATLLGEDADVAEARLVGKGGVSVSSVEDIGKLLHGVDLERTPVFVQAGASGIPMVSMILALVEKQSGSKEKLHGCVGADPLGELAREGRLPRAMSGAYDDMAQLTAWAGAHAPNLQTVLVRGHPYHDGGGSAVQELAFAIATGVEYLREMQARGVSVDQAAPRVLFAFSLGSNFFMEIAKLRAARVLWAKVIKEFRGDEDSQKMRIHARTSGWNKTLYDPNVNMLRSTTEAFSGVLGGCDSMHIGPMDEIARVPSDFTRRVARNAHTVLRDEAGLTRTVDPAGGSWYVENLTDSVARSAWDLFREVEKQGGMAKALQSGFVQEQVAGVSARRAKAYAQRRDVLVGTNMYANMADKPLEVSEIDHSALQQSRAADLKAYRDGADAQWRQSALEKLAQAGAGNRVEAAVHAVMGGATLGDLCGALCANETMDPLIDPLKIQRGAQAFEKLRRRSEAFAQSTGALPKVFLANMGPIPQHKARADFSRGFLEVGAFDVIGNNGFETGDQAVVAALDSGAPVVVICSTDKTYPDLVPPLAKGIKDAKPETIVLLAGYPSDHIDAFKQAGVDDFIHVRANCYELLDNLQNRIGVAQ